MSEQTISLNEQTISLNEQTVPSRVGQVKEQLTSILGGDQKMIAFVKLIVAKPKYQPAAAYFLARGANKYQVNSCFRELQELDARKKVSAIRAGKNGVSLNGQMYINWLRFGEAVHSLSAANDDFRAKILGVVTDIKPIATGDNNNITITRGKNPSEACQLGMGTKWCISDPKQGMFASYRNTESATFYFVEDWYRPETSPLRRVVINVTNSGVSLTDLDNTTGTIAEFGDDVDRYMDYLYQEGVDTSVLKNDPLTPEETTLNKKLEAVADSLDRYDEFVNLPSALKSEFISRAYQLITEELTFLASNKLDGLMNQYLNVGHAMSEGDFAVIAKNPAWVETFKRKRTQYIEHDFKLMTTSDANILPELFEQARPDLEKSLAEYHKITEAGDYGEYNAAYEELPAYYKEDQAFALAEHQAGNIDFADLPCAIQDDLDFALAEYRAGKIVFSMLPNVLKNYPTFALAEYRAGKVDYPWLPDEIRRDTTFALAEYRAGHVNFSALPQELQNDPVFALAEYQADKIDLQWLPKELRNDRDFALEAYRAGKARFTWLPDVLKDDPDFALEAYRSDKAAFLELPAVLRTDPKLALEAYKAGHVPFAWLPDVLRNDPKKI